MGLWVTRKTRIAGVVVPRRARCDCEGLRLMSYIHEKNSVDVLGLLCRFARALSSLQWFGTRLLRQVTSNAKRDINTSHALSFCVQVGNQIHKQTFVISKCPQLLQQYTEIPSRLLKKFYRVENEVKVFLLKFSYFLLQLGYFEVILSHFWLHVVN